MLKFHRYVQDSHITMIVISFFLFSFLSIIISEHRPTGNCVHIRYILMKCINFDSGRKNVVMATKENPQEQKQVLLH